MFDIAIVDILHGIICIEWITAAWVIMMGILLIY